MGEFKVPPPPQNNFGVGENDKEKLNIKKVYQEKSDSSNIEASPTQDLMNQAHDLFDNHTKNPLIYYSYDHWTEGNKEEKIEAQKNLDALRKQISLFEDEIRNRLKSIAEKNSGKYKNSDSLKTVALGEGFKNIPGIFEYEYVNMQNKIKKQNVEESMSETIQVLVRLECGEQRWSLYKW